MWNCQAQIKGPHSPQQLSEKYKEDDPHALKMPRHSEAVVFSINPFREMVVKVHPHLNRSDIVKMAYIMELPYTFEEDMGTLRDPFIYFIQAAEKAGLVNGNHVDMLINSLVLLKKEEALQVVREYKGKNLQPFQEGSAWTKAAMSVDSEQKTAEKDYSKYWSKFQDWCNRQNILDAKMVPLKKVIEYLTSLTSSNKMPTIMNYYNGILQHHQEFKPSDKEKLEAHIKLLKEQEKNSKK